MTWRQSNNQWGGGIAAHHAPKNSECKNPLEKFSPRFIGGSRRHLPHWLRSKGPNYQHGVLLIAAGAIEGHFEGKTLAAGRSPRGSSSCTTMARLTGHVQPGRNWHTWASNVFIAYTIIWIWHRRTTTCSLDWGKKNNWKINIFRPTRRLLLPRRPGWTDILLNFFFLSGLQNLEHRAKKCIEIRAIRTAVTITT